MALFQVGTFYAMLWAWMPFSDHHNHFPLIILFDLMSAFPRVAHDWLFLSLKHAGANTKLLNFIHALYENVRVFVF